MDNATNSVDWTECLKSTDSRWRYWSNNHSSFTWTAGSSSHSFRRNHHMILCLSYFRRRRPICRPSSRSWVNRLWALVNTDSGEILMCSCCMRSERNTRQPWSHKPRKLWFRLSLSRSLPSLCTPRPACEDQRTITDKLKQMCAVWRWPQEHKQSGVSWTQMKLRWNTSNRY